MPDVHTSRVFAVIGRLYTLLADETTFTQNPKMAEKPKVFLGGTALDESLEPIIIIGIPDDQPALDFATVGQVGVDEKFGLRVYVGALCQGQSGPTALARLGELVGTVESALRDQTTGRPKGGFTGPVYGCIWWRIARISPRLGKDTEGIVASADLDIVFQTRI